MANLKMLQEIGEELFDRVRWVVIETDPTRQWNEQAAHVRNGIAVLFVMAHNRIVDRAQQWSSSWREWMNAVEVPAGATLEDGADAVAAALEDRFPGGPAAHPSPDALRNLVGDTTEAQLFVGVDRDGKPVGLESWSTGLVGAPSVPGELAGPLRDGEYTAHAKATVDIRELPDSPPMVTEVAFRPVFDEAPNCVVRTFTKDEMDAMAELRAASDRQLEAQAAPGQVERDVSSALAGYPLLYGRETVRAAPSFEVTGPPMRGKCVGCGIDLDVLVANGKLGHVCNGRPPMDIDHLHKLVTACIEECEATNDTGPAYDELVAYLGECGFVSRTVVAKAMADVTADVIADVVWKGKLFMLGRGLVEACDIAESWGPKTSEAQQAIFQDRIAELREMAVKFNATGDAQPDFVDVVFDGPPGHEAGRFVEVEDSKGNSISIGEWIDRKDGMWALRIPRAVQR